MVRKPAALTAVLCAACVFAGTVLAESGPGQSSGQTVYVAVYSHIYGAPKGMPIDLTVTLSLRNTDLQHAISIISVQYYDSKGRKIKDYLEKPAKLDPLGTTHFLVKEYDRSGGSGANFIVRWKSDQPVNLPIFEAVHISTRSGLGISFLTRGMAIKDKP